MSMNSKGSMNYSCLIFSLPAVSCNLIFFFCTDACASRDASQSKQRKAANHTLLESLPLKNKLAQVSDTIEACYHNDQTETRKITNAYEVFFLSELAYQRHNALSLNGAGLISQSTANFSDVAQDEIARFRISETWRKHRPLCFRYVSVRRKREIQIIVASFTFPLCFLNGNANLRFRHVSDCRFPLVFVSVTFLSTDLLCVCYAQIELKRSKTENE